MHNKRVIMVEGCDRTGKSTFIEILSKKLIAEGKTPFIFRLMGPNIFKCLDFNNNDLSLIQLAKFDEAYNMINTMLKQNMNTIVILDRCHFGELTWAYYWNRQGKFTEFLESNDFYIKHKELFDKSVYINYFISKLNILENRIKDSEEDTNIFTINNMSIKDNIQGVYALYEDVNYTVKHKFNMSFAEYDNINDLSEVEKFANHIIDMYIK
jgi:thymidylate kinase